MLSSLSWGCNLRKMFLKLRPFFSPTDLLKSFQIGTNSHIACVWKNRSNWTIPCYYLIVKYIVFNNIY
jgi:hypothetical protein